MLFRSLEAKGNPIIDARSPWDAVEAFKPVIAAVKKNGSLCIAQLTHGGRQTADTINPDPMSSSDVQVGPWSRCSPHPPPIPLSSLQIRPLEYIANPFSCSCSILVIFRQCCSALLGWG